MLHHDELDGKVDATADRKTSLRQVPAVHQDVRFTRDITAAVHAELKALAQWLGLDDVRFATGGSGWCSCCGCAPPMGDPPTRQAYKVMLTWMVQPIGAWPATVAVVVLAAAGTLAYEVLGSRR